MEAYRQRKKHLVAVLTKEWKVLQNKVHFIMKVLDVSIYTHVYDDDKYVTLLSINALC